MFIYNICVYSISLLHCVYGPWVAMWQPVIKRIYDDDNDDDVWCQICVRVCLSICVLVATVRPAKANESIEMPFNCGEADSRRRAPKEPLEIEIWLPAGEYDQTIKNSPDRGLRSSTDLDPDLGWPWKSYRRECLIDPINTTIWFVAALCLIVDVRTHGHFTGFIIISQKMT